MNKPKFSFIIPVYNTADYLDDCLNSILNQSYNNIEIILVNDGSTDDSPEKCEFYAAKDSRIIVIHQENKGLGGARNTGIYHAKGEYLFFVDSDDYIDEDTCLTLLPYTMTQAQIITGEGIVNEGENVLAFGNRDKGLFSSYEFIKRVFPDGRVPMAVVIYIYKNSFLKDHGLLFKDRIYHEDEEFTPRALLAANSIYKSDIPFYYYVKRESSITRSANLEKNLKDLKDIVINLEKLYENIDDHLVKRHLLNSLATKYLSLFQDSGLYDREEYYHKKLLKRTSKTLRNKLKVGLFSISPYLYWHINHQLKKRKVSQIDE